MIASLCDAYVMHGDEPRFVAEKIADMKRRRESFGLPPMQYGMAAYAIVRDTEAEAKKEVERITKIDPNAAGFANFDQWLSGTQLERELKVQEYSVSNRGLASSPRRHARTGGRAGRSVRGGGAGPAPTADEPAVRGNGAVFGPGDQAGGRGGLNPNSCLSPPDLFRGAHPDRVWVFEAA